MDDRDYKQPGSVRFRVAEEPWSGDRPRGATTPFPWLPVLAVGSVILLHVIVVAWHMGAFPAGETLLLDGGLKAGATLEEPWRLFTSLALHVDLRHALANGLAMMVFAVPLITDLGLGRTTIIYVAAGVGGGAAALGFAHPGQITVGSSGAVAGLFGAWVVLRLRASRVELFPWRARVRAAGVALLFLPSLLNPTTPAGQPISISSHLGGMFTGMLIGAVLSGSLIRGHELQPDEDEDEEPFEHGLN